jgi:hypothetical protein
MWQEVEYQLTVARSGSAANFEIGLVALTSFVLFFYFRWFVYLNFSLKTLSVIKAKVVFCPYAELSTTRAFAVWGEVLRHAFLTH